jgi:hypothetical protein
MYRDSEMRELIEGRDELSRVWRRACSVNVPVLHLFSVKPQIGESSGLDA